MAPPPGSDLTVPLTVTFCSLILIGRRKRQSGPVGVAAVKVEVQLNNVDRWLAGETEGSAVGVGIQDRAQLVDAYAASFCHACHLQLCIGGADVWIESASAGCDCGGWDKRAGGGPTPHVGGEGG